MNFKKLLLSISETHETLRDDVARYANRTLTIRNWLIGYYIVEYEQNGMDRAKYGERLLEELSSALKKKNFKGASVTNLRLFRLFYCAYPQIHQSVTDELNNFKFRPRIHQSATDESQMLKSPVIKAKSHAIKPETLLAHLTFTHFIELLKIDDPLKRMFYEIESVKGNWAVRQLKRQIESLLFERTGLSKNKTALIKRVHDQNEIATPEDLIRDPYVLEFTGMPERKEYSENDLEAALLDHIQEFLIELGNGFCFEARQKRITVDDEHDRIDLVFYHRILKCHVLIDLKVRKFSHADAGQMNFYLNYYRENIMAKGDNPPVGIILCTDRNTTKVKYAITGLDNKLFVSRYKIALPSEKELEELIKRDVEKYEN